MTFRTLDWKSRHDPRSLNYGVDQLIETRPERRKKLWTPGVITDQGAEGACVGHAWTGEATASPIRADLKRLKHHAPKDPNAFALYLYRMAQQIDEWAGEDYEGTSVLAGAKAAQNVGLLESYAWAFDVESMIDAILDIGPVVIGIPWYKGMYSAPNGVLSPSGTLAGGHSIYVPGYDPESELIKGKETFTIVNSWGEGYGNQGLAEITKTDMAWLLQYQGEVCVPLTRSYGRS